MKRAEPREIADRLAGKPLIVMLDIDGTLCEIVERPDEARIPDTTRLSLRALIGAPERYVHVVLVTGRSVADARRMIGIDGVAIYGNHGMERLSASGNIRGPEGWEQTQSALREAVRDLADVVAEFPGTSLEDKGFTLTVHFRGMDPAHVPELRARVADVVRRHSLRLASGKSVINVLPSNASDKGDAVTEIVRDRAVDAHAASVLFVGDDVTDEDGFRALRAVPSATTVRVGSADAESAAQFSLDSPRQVASLLALLAESHS